MIKKIAIFGSTGSIGVNALEVVRQHPNRFKIVCLTAHHNAVLLAEQALAFNPETVCIGTESGRKVLKEKLKGKNIQIVTGEQALCDLAREEDFDTMIGAIVGFAGFMPTIEAIKAGKNIGLANKETLVAGGDLVNRLMEKHKVQLIPIDSEHSALFQCLVGENPNSIRKLILTASGGPFRELPAEEFGSITLSRALKHPNWSMGAKITIDSATLMNKGLEVIEAHWLFGVDRNRIDVIIHPQSIIHSMVEFTDSSVKAQLGLPDMKLPIQYALAYPERLPNELESLDLKKIMRLEFHEPDRKKFRCLQLAYDALAIGGTMPAVLNGANESALGYFLQEKISFTDIPKLIETTMQNHSPIALPTLEDIIEADRWARSEVINRAGA